jgi:putative Mn2+ efflux pump MntP
MLFIQVFLIGLGLSADAFAVAISNGLSLREASRRQAFRIAAAFGLFQGVMPLLGFLLGSVFAEFINNFAPWIALIFLGSIGVKMIIDELSSKNKVENYNAHSSLPFRTLMLQAVATSIDALVVGVSFIAMGITGLQVLPCVAIIGVTTFALSFTGVNLGKKFGKLFGGRAKIIGGLILLGIGLKVFIEHLFI